MRSMTDKVVAELMRIQKAEGLSDAELCRRTGIDAGQWSRVKRGEGLGPLNVARAALVYPHLTQIYADALTEYGATRA